MSYFSTYFVPNCNIKSGALILERFVINRLIHKSNLRLARRKHTVHGCLSTPSFLREVYLDFEIQSTNGPEHTFEKSALLIAKYFSNVKYLLQCYFWRICSAWWACNYIAIA